MDRVKLEFKANQDREKIKESILYNILFQNDDISGNISFRGDEWSLREVASMRALRFFCEHDQK